MSQKIYLLMTADQIHMLDADHEYFIPAVLFDTSTLRVIPNTQSKMLRGESHANSEKYPYKVHLATLGDALPVAEAFESDYPLISLNDNDECQYCSVGVFGNETNACFLSLAAARVLRDDKGRPLSRHAALESYRCIKSALDENKFPVTSVTVNASLGLSQELLFSHAIKVVRSDALLMRVASYEAQKCSTLTRREV